MVAIATRAVYQLLFTQRNKFPCRLEMLSFQGTSQGITKWFQLCNLIFQTAGFKSKKGAVQFMIVC